MRALATGAKLAAAGQRSAAIAALVAGWLCALSMPPAVAQEPDNARPDWPTVKCELYRKAWQDVLTQRRTEGLGAAFVERNEAFIASGCKAKGDVCPRTPQELEIANVLSLKVMNAGVTGSFLPFACRN